MSVSPESSRGSLATPCPRPTPSTEDTGDQAEETQWGTQPARLEGGDPTPYNKEEPQTPSLQKGDPKHCHINKMKRQRNIQQVKEDDKCTPNQTRGEDRESILKRIQNNDSKDDQKP